MYDRPRADLEVCELRVTYRTRRLRQVDLLIRCRHPCAAVSDVSFLLSADAASSLFGRVFLDENVKIHEECPSTELKRSVMANTQKAEAYDHGNDDRHQSLRQVVVAPLKPYSPSEASP